MSNLDDVRPEGRRYDPPAVAVSTGLAERLPRLAPGHHLYRAPDGGWRCSMPGDRFLRLRTDVPEMADFAAVLSGTVPPPDGHRRGPAFDSLLRALWQQGLLVEPTEPVARPRTGVVHVEGSENPLGRRVVQLLSGEVTVRSGCLDEAAISACDVLVTCAGWLPDSTWQRVDSWCIAARTAWHMAYVEGTRIYLGPLYQPGVAASYRDTRGRRLAAALAPEELLALWCYLDSEVDHPPVPWPGAGPIAVAAGYIVTDVLAYLDGASVPGGEYQIEIDPADLITVRHPVLPLPPLAD